MCLVCYIRFNVINSLSVFVTLLSTILLVIKVECYYNCKGLKTEMTDTRKVFAFLVIGVCTFNEQTIACKGFWQ